MDGEKSSFRSQGSPVKCDSVYRDAIPTHTPTPTQTLTGTITESPTPTSTYTSTPTPTATTIPTPTDVPPLDSASYTYDGDGNLVKSVVNGVSTYYPARHFSLEIGLTGDTQRKYYSANGQTIAVNENGILSWILTDHLGSTSGTVDANGSPVSTLLYTAFGETRLENGATNTDYRYTGHTARSASAMGAKKPNLACTFTTRAGTTRRWGALLSRTAWCRTRATRRTGIATRM